MCYEKAGFSQFYCSYFRGKFEKRVKFMLFTSYFIKIVCFIYCSISKFNKNTNGIFDVLFLQKYWNYLTTYCHYISKKRSFLNTNLNIKIIQ